MINLRLVFGPTNSTNLFHGKLGTLTKNMKQAAKNLGIIFGEDLCFDALVKNVVQLLSTQENL